MSSRCFAVAAGGSTRSSINSNIEQNKQVFLARVQLEAYESELETYGVGRKLGFGDLLARASRWSENGFLTYFEMSLRELAFNTFNVGRLLFTNKEARLLNEWIVQHQQLDHTIAALKIVSDIMTSRAVTLPEAIRIIDVDESYAEVRPWVNHLAQSSWAMDIATGTRLPMRPVLPGDFGLNFKTDFVDEDWQSLLLQQLNIANVYVFWRGKAMVSAFGESRLGAKLARTLHLNKLIDAVRRLPAPLQGPTLWMLYETADGCTVRYFQIAYVAIHQFGRNRIIRLTQTIPR